MTTPGNQDPRLETKEGAAPVAPLAEAEVFQEQPGLQRRSSPIVRWWRNVGGGSLTLSLMIHAGVLSTAGVVVLVSQIQETPIDFMPGGGTSQGAEASNELAHRVQQKKRKSLTQNVPLKKVISANMDAALTLPDAPLDLFDVPDLSKSMEATALTSGGFGSGGAGGGFGNGVGMGGMNGITFKPIMMFGTELKDARKIAVVMDVSRSMTKFLPIVAKELDKVARGSPLVLYFGCGLRKPPRGLEDKVLEVDTAAFDKFWYYWEGRQDMKMLRTEYKKLEYQRGQKMPLEAIYEQMVKRRNTYFIDFNGIQYASPALMCREVMEADTIYWFADFQDAVDAAHIEEIVKKLKSRKQKLYIHASIRGRSFEIVRDKLVTPLGGEVIETKAE